MLGRSGGGAADAAPCRSVRLECAWCPLQGPPLVDHVGTLSATAAPPEWSGFGSGKRDDCGRVCDCVMRWMRQRSVFRAVLRPSGGCGSQCGRWAVCHMSALFSRRCGCMLIECGCAVRDESPGAQTAAVVRVRCLPCGAHADGAALSVHALHADVALLLFVAGCVTQVPKRGARCAPHYTFWV